MLFQLDAFLLQQSNNKLQFSICGLFAMDHTILNAVGLLILKNNKKLLQLTFQIWIQRQIIASAVSYTFLLIQFELDEIK